MLLGQSLLLQGQRPPVGETCGERLRQNLNATSHVPHGTSHDDFNLPLHWDPLQLPKLLPQNPRWQRDTCMSLEVYTCKHGSSGLHMCAIENEIIIIILFTTMNSIINFAPPGSYSCAKASFKCCNKRVTRLMSSIKRRRFR